MKETNAKNIWVYIELNEEGIHPSSYQLLAKAKELSKMKQEKVVAVLLEKEKDQFEMDLGAYGADEVIVLKNEAFSNFNPMLYQESLTNLVQKYEPSVFLFAATHHGRALAPRLQGALQTGLSADCLDLSINDQGILVQIKPSYGDNLMCSIVIPNATPQMATIRPGVFKALDYQENAQAKIIYESIHIEKRHVYEIMSSNPILKPKDNLQNAKTIVTLGRGMKTKDNCEITQTLANLLEAKLGVTRPLAENGWYNIDKQIGQSGINVAPKLLLNFGISGAVQYTVGIRNAEFTFSVNKDKDAQIFKESDFGYVGDATQFAQAFIALLDQ